jgi:GNAT superfamily N-acetyltransferase
MNHVEIVPARSDLVAQILKLWRSESATLGFMPQGAFEEAADEGCLLAAVDDDRRLCGYILFRRTGRKQTSIAHLCIEPVFRGQGIARLLVEELKKLCTDSYELRLRCRRDFSANELWPRLGFVPVSDQAGKGRDSLLTTWRYELATLPLLRMLASARQERALRVVIDANIFFDLDEEGSGHEESRGLRADWLDEFVEIHLTEEILTEINRRESREDRERQRARAERIPRIGRESEREEQIFPSIRALLPTDDRPSTTSDARQIAMTVAAGVTFFVTRDGNILDVADQLYEMFDLRVVQPHELILRFDELRRESDYRPKRLFLGPDIRRVQPRSDDLDRVADLLYVGQPITEPRKHTLARLRELLATPATVDATCIERGDDLLAAFFIDRSVPGTLLVPYFAVHASSLGCTAARHYSEHLVKSATEEGRQLIKVRDGGGRVGDALADVGFSKEGDFWVKIALPITGDATAVAAVVDRLGSENPEALAFADRVAGQLRRVAAGPGVARTRSDLAQIERVLWPAKITATGLPCFVVPIQPRWAKDLFDRELAQGTLFGGKASLVLNSENVYYRAAKPGTITAPARVFWYVSQDASYPGSMALRACSYVDEVVVAPPKEVFRRFKRIGIYEWQDVFGLAKNDLEKDIMAFRFVKTEQMQTPVGWTALQSILQRHGGKGSQIQSPLEVSEDCFLELYRTGMGDAVDAA